MTWIELQAEHMTWVSREYPDQPLEVPAAGMVEEAGELLHAALKLHQATLWGKEERYPKLREDFIDAIGDCVIYCCSACNTMDVSLADVMARASCYGPNAAATAMDVAVLAVQHGAAFYELRQTARMSEYLACVRRAAELAGLDFKECTRATWEKVRMRRRGAPQPPARRKVCLCGSTRFKAAFIQANFEETMAGRLVYSVGFFSHADSAVYQPTPEEKAALDALHIAKIDASDEILVIDEELVVCIKCKQPYNGGPRHSDCCGAIGDVVRYWGDSTKREIAHAERTGKPVRYRSKEKER